MEFEPHDVEWTPEKVGRLWSYYGSSPSHAGLYFSARSGALILDRIEREAGLAGRTVLDFGCGRGDLLELLLERRVAGAAGLEFDAATAATADGRLRGRAGFGGITVAAGLPSALPAGSFERILLVEVVEHLLDDQVAPTLAEVHRLLAPGGRVAVTVPNGEDLEAGRTRCPDCGGTFHLWQHQRSFTPASLAAFVERQGGLRTVSSQAVLWGPEPRLRRLRRLQPYRPHLLYVGERAA